MTTPAPLSPPPKGEGWQELDEVRLARNIWPAGHQFVPVGALGVVMGVYADGQACEVEFTTPFHAVVTCLCADLEIAP